MKIVIIVVVIAVVLLLIWQYNRLIGLKNKVESGWSQIDVQLQRRYDLIPNLVETVKGYAAHEANTLQAVTEARNIAQNANGPAEQGQAENMLSGALKSLFAVSEAYPRQFYNETVMSFNTAITQIPGNLIAGPMNLKEREYFEVEGGPEARGPVKVQF